MRSTIRPVAWVTLALLLAGGAGCAEMTARFRAWWRQYDEPPPTVAEATTEPAAHSPQEIESVLLDRPPVPLTDAQGARPPAAKKLLPREGTILIDAPCRMTVEPVSGWPVLTFDREPGEKIHLPRRVLPCLLREEMENLLADDPKLTFRVTGETTVCDAQAYFLLRRVTVLHPQASPLPGAARPVSSPATGPARPANGPLSSEEIRRMLLEDRPGAPVVTVRPRATGEGDEPGVAPGRRGSPLAPGRGGLVADRLVNIDPPADQQGWWVASFAGDNTLREPPIRLLPSGLLERTQKAILDRPRDLFEFRLSGEITEYRGYRYLLIRKCIPEREMGQF